MNSHKHSRHVGIAIGSPRTKVCSVGAFARAEGAGFEAAGWKVNFIEPDEGTWRYPMLPPGGAPPYILIHMPSLFERRKPWNALVTMAALRVRAPRSRLLLNIHEYSEAPVHWRMRAFMAAQLAHGLLVNTQADEGFIASWGKPFLRYPLGPTLWNEALFSLPTATTLESERDKARARLASHVVGKFISEGSGPLLVHGGMITAGKGIEFLERWCGATSGRAAPFRFLLMGGLGPKERDRQFADERITKFRAALGNRFFWLPEAPDELYKDILIAADAVVLPFEQGLSERRSTFLSACSCGAAVWATEGQYTASLRLPPEAAWLTPAGDEPAAAASLEELLRELSSGPTTTERRLAGVSWARERGWTYRVQALEKFLSNLC